MGSEKTTYWIAVGVLALLVSNNFVIRHEDGVHELASRSLAAIEQVSGHATRFMAVAEMTFGKGGARFAQTQTTLACAQTRLASVQGILASHEAALARVEAEHARISAMQQIRGPVICPRQRLRMGIQPLRDGTM
jgi:hypothetical protein